jgi:hypothetical protein
MAYKLEYDTGVARVLNRFSKELRRRIIGRIDIDVGHRRDIYRRK